MTVNEFSPYDEFARILRLWWLVVLITMVGGGLGYVFYHLHPPQYEATATFFVTLDVNQLLIQDVREDLIQYNEDMALQTTQGALLAPTVLDQVIQQAGSYGILLTGYDLVNNSTIERKHDLWELRYRSTDALNAQTVVNLWAHLGYDEMLRWQSTGKTPAYVIFQPPTDALTPTEPVLYGRNKVMLAGSIAGFIVAVILTNRLAHLRSLPEVED